MGKAIYGFTMPNENEFLRTCFIVGAGASCDFDFPVGSDLVDDISRLLAVNFSQQTASLNPSAGTLCDQLNYGRDKRLDLELGLFQQVSANMPLAPSIDNFLEAHSHNTDIYDIGRAAIAQIILERERQSKLFFKTGLREINFSDIRGTWISVLFRMLAEASDWDRFLERLGRNTFICFNYDRMIERFLFLACMQYYGKDEKTVRDALEANLRIKHPYGKVGKDIFKLHGSDFGGSNEGLWIKNASNGIKTFTEGLADDGCQDSFEAYFGEAEALCFLGFGFHSINMRHLANAGRAENAKYVMATAYGFSKNFKSIVEAEILGSLVSSEVKEIDFEDVTCDCPTLLLNYQARLSGRGKADGAGFKVL